VAISEKHRTSFIAELGINHCGLERHMLSLVRQAAIAGADVFKTQAYDVDALFPNQMCLINGRNWYPEVKKTQLTKDQVLMMAAECDKVGIEFMCSVFDLERLRWVEEAGVMRHKVAARERHNLALIQAMLATGKTVILSTPVWKDWAEGIVAAPRQLRIMYCPPGYPSEPGGLTKINFGRSGFDGFSDHSVDIEAPAVAAVSGARIIEKHIRPFYCESPDAECSLPVSKFAEMVALVRKLEQVM
jgi:sialic acid synthase SpsE